jgi:hypothetical protein
VNAAIARPSSAPGAARANDALVVNGRPVAAGSLALGAADLLRG